MAASPGPGHIIKGRYTSLQADVGSTEEHLESLAEVESIDGMPVVAAALHSQLPAVAAAFKAVRPDARLAYVMTDGAGLPIAMSDLVAAMCEPRPRRRHHHVRPRVRRRLRGGVGVLRARGRAPRRARRRRGRRDGPGHRRHQHPARVQRHGGRPDPRRRERVSAACRSRACGSRSPTSATRHVGLSHHSATALRIATRERVQVAVPGVADAEQDARLRGDLDAAGIDRRHDLVDVDAPDALDAARAATTCGSRRWAGPRPTTPRCSRPPPPPVRSAARHVDG